MAEGAAPWVFPTASRLVPLPRRPGAGWGFPSSRGRENEWETSPPLAAAPRRTVLLREDTDLRRGATLTSWDASPRWLPEVFGAKGNVTGVFSARSLPDGNLRGQMHCGLTAATTVTECHPLPPLSPLSPLSPAVTLECGGAVTFTCRDRGEWVGARPGDTSSGGAVPPSHRDGARSPRPGRCRVETPRLGTCTPVSPVLQQRPSDWQSRLSPMDRPCRPDQ